MGLIVATITQNLVCLQQQGLLNGIEMLHDRMCVK